MLRSANILQENTDTCALIFGMGREQKMKTENDVIWFRVIRPTLFAMAKAMADGKLSSTDVVVYLILKSLADFKTGISFPSRFTVAQHLGKSEATIKRSIKNLAEAGFLTREQRDGRSNVYRLMEQMPILLPDEKVKLARWQYIPKDEKIRGNN